MASERGQTSAEYMGVVLIVGAILAAILASGVGERLTAGLKSAICEVAQADDCGFGGGAAGGDRAASTPGGEQGAEGPGQAAESGAAGDDDRSANPERSDSADAEEPPPGAGFGPSSPGPPPPVPGAPEPPPPPPDDLDGSGEFDSEDPGILGDIENEALEEAAYRGADAFEAIGREDAARHMRHFLGESGDPLEVDPARMLRDIETFRVREQDERDDMIRDIQREAARRYDGKPFSFTVDDRDWEQGSPSDPAVLGDNWFYALGGFSFTHTASVRVTPPEKPGDPPRVQIDYQTHVFDRYNWDKGKSVNIGPITVSDEELQQLHRAGMAQDFDVYGSTGTETVTVDADANAPDEDPPGSTPEAGGDEGGRRDPGRERGRDDRREPSDRDRQGRGGR